MYRVAYSAVLLVRINRRDDTWSLNTPTLVLPNEKGVTSWTLVVSKGHRSMTRTEMTHQPVVHKNGVEYLLGTALFRMDFDGQNTFPIL